MKQTMGILLLLGLGVARGQTHMGLDSIFSVIGRSHPALRSSDAQARSLDEAAKGAANWEAPTISTGWWMTPYDPSRWKRQSDGASGMGQYMISAEQMFPNRRNQAAEERYLGGLSAVERAKKGSTLNELHAAAGRAYFQWLISQRKKTVLEEDGRLLDFMIHDAELKYKDNLGKIGGYYRARAAAGKLENRRIGLENSIEQQKIALNILMDRDPATPFGIDSSYTLMDLAAVGADSADLLEQRSDIREVSESIRVTTLEQDAERAKLLPEFGVRYDHMFGFGGTPMQYSLMATMRLPMTAWSSRASRANVASLKWKERSLQADRETMINAATGEVYGLRQAIVSGQHQIRVLEEQVLPALRGNFQTMELAYEQNTEELSSLYDAWQALDDQQTEYWDMLENLLLTQVEYRRVLELK